MLSEESDHLECLRESAQPRLSAARLLALLRERTGFNGVQTKKKGKKSTINDTKSKKRTHGGDGDGKNTRKRLKISQEDAISLSDTDEERLFHAFQRVFRIRYTTSSTGRAPPVDDAVAEQLGWPRDEKALQDWLAAYASTVDDPKTIDLGLVSVDSFSYAPIHVRTIDDNSQTLLILPRLRPSAFNYSDYDFGQQRNPIRDPLQAFQVLAKNGRARISARLFLVESFQQDELPFALRLQVDCSFVCPKIFEPVTAEVVDQVVASRKFASENARVFEIQEAQRRLVLHLFPPQTLIPSSYHGSTDIPFLFSILRPAPALPSPEAYNALQPDTLLPTLLPFQRRSVAWMLEREGNVVTASGAIVPQSELSLDEQPLPLFWDRFPVSVEETWYINRLRGLISATRPTGEDDDLNEDALGGIVAEEPGLGKTLECISTVIMNPAPPSRTPLNKRWDAEAKIDIKEVKVSICAPLLRA